ncbi:MAG: FtsW/RodA/SpoVE family cell cycle protein [Pirellulales bacterium]|nr:FtsW/RodA/SpoVE family cell cycle protein [Pirellulales bacterium]
MDAFLPLRSRWPVGLMLPAIALFAGGLAAITRAEMLAAGEIRLASRQAVAGTLAALLTGFVVWPSYRRLWRFAYLGLAGVVVALVAVYFLPPVAGVHRWIRVGPIGVQPSEFAKVVYVVALARWLTYRENFRRLPGLVAPLLLTLVPVLLVLKEPDLGTAMVFPPLLFAMLFAAGARRRHLACISLVAVLLAPLLWSQMSREQRSRVTALFEQNAPEQRPADDGYQLHQAKQVAALGGAWGSWLSGTTVDDPGAYHLPAAATDFIFSMWGERFGLAGQTALIALFALIVAGCLRVATSTQEPFGRLLAVGVAALFAAQVLINTGMTVGLLPVTGLSLPLVSYGGSGLLAHALALGLVLNVGLRADFEVTGEPFRFARRRGRWN